MDRLHSLLADNAAISLATGGLLIGLFFGFLVQRTNFCAMGSISDMMAFGDSRRFRSWLLASATAIAGAAVLNAMGVADLSKSQYLSPTLDWMGAILGGLVFGFGMVFAGGCATRNLVRAGGGDLRSLIVVILIGISGYMAIGGLLGPARVALSGATSISLAGFGLKSQSLAGLVAQLAHINPDNAAAVTAVGLVALLLAVCFSSASFRSSPVHILAGLGVGIAVVAGWALTGLTYDEMAETAVNPTSLTFVRPSGDLLDWMQRFTAQPIPGFGTSTVLGVLAGAYLAALIFRSFRISTFSDTADTARNLFGAVLMGIGGVFALGCTIGQGVTGVSTLAMGSMLTFAGLVLGGVIGIKTMERLA